ncbi:MAG: helix-hairpin-helix domain-containing protein, partial [Chitinophagales bacterium]|nr:helix-hairpin-helix domain-containing protein [Chitinophagales bacterium]
MDSLSQDIPTDILEDLAEQAESEDGEFDNNTFLEDLELLSAHKINLNNTTVDELMKTTVLTELQANSIINYRNTYGDFQSIYELKGVLGMDMATIDKLLPFIVIADPDSKIYTFKDELTKGKHTIMYRTQMNLEKAKGYTPPDLYQGRLTSRYVGDRTRQYLRYRYQFWKGISYGITLEKDPGEKLFNKDVKLRIDYVSAHLFLEHKGNFRFIALGDFEVNLGQGLTMWQGFGVGKSISVNSMKRTADVLKPHTSVIEDNFNRGAGATFQKKSFEVTAFASYRKRDGSSIAVDTLTNDILEVQTLQTSGLHRTESELKNRAGVGLFATGGRVGWSNRLFSVYFNSTYHRLASVLTPSS